MTPVSNDAVARPCPIDPDRLTLPIELLNYAYDQIFLGWYGGPVDLGAAMPCYRKIIGYALAEIKRLQDEASAGVEP